VRTERLVLRPAAARHAPALLAYHERNRAHLAPWEPRRPDDFYTLPHWEIDTAHSERVQRLGTAAQFLAFEPDGPDRIVAIVNLHQILRGVIQRAVLGYSIDAGYEGRGMAREAVGAVVAFAFEKTGLHRIEANYQPTNVRSGKLLRALGFAVEGYARAYLFIDGAWRDHVMTSRINSSAAQ
jgi:ribosomal-protein-alanine N-acetyltransferase